MYQTGVIDYFTLSHGANREFDFNQTEKKLVITCINFYGIMIFKQRGIMCGSGEFHREDQRDTFCLERGGGMRHIFEFLIFKGEGCPDGPNSPPLPF